MEEQPLSSLFPGPQPELPAGWQQSGQQEYHSSSDAVSEKKLQNLAHPELYRTLEKMMLQGNLEKENIPPESGVLPGKSSDLDIGDKIKTKQINNLLKFCELLVLDL